MNVLIKGFIMLLGVFCLEDTISIGNFFGVKIVLSCFLYFDTEIVYTSWLGRWSIMWETFCVTFLLLFPSGSS